MSAFPKMVYRAAGYELLNRIVEDEQGLALAGVEGWTDHATASKDLTPAPPPEPKKTTGKKNAAVDKEQADQIINLSEEIGANAAELEARALRIAKLETFVSAIAEGEDMPEEVRALARELLGIDPKPAKPAVVSDAGGKSARRK